MSNLETCNQAERQGNLPSKQVHIHREMVSVRVFLLKKDFFAQDLQQLASPGIQVKTSEVHVALESGLAMTRTLMVAISKVPEV